MKVFIIHGESGDIRGLAVPHPRIDITRTGIRPHRRHTVTLVEVDDPPAHASKDQLHQHLRDLVAQHRMHKSGETRTASTAEKVARGDLREHHDASVAEAQKERSLMTDKSHSSMHISIESVIGAVDGFPVVRRDERTVDVSSMRSMDQQRLQKILKDHQILGDVLQRHAKEVSAIVSDVLAGRVDSARAKAESIGLTEAAFGKKSGGLIGWVIAAVVIGILLYSKDAN